MIIVTFLIANQFFVAFRNLNSLTHESILVSQSIWQGHNSTMEKLIAKILFLACFFVFIFSKNKHQGGGWGAYHAVIFLFSLHCCVLLGKVIVAEYFYSRGRGKATTFWFIVECEVTDVNATIFERF